jgi:hypothetical protein
MKGDLNFNLTMGTKGKNHTGYFGWGCAGEGISAI